MYLTDFLALVTRLFFFLVAVITVVNFLRHRNPTRFDIALVFGALGLIVVLQEVTALTGSTPPWVSLITSIALLAHPYLLLRVVQHFRPVQRTVTRLAALGMLAFDVLLIWALVVIGAPLPQPFTLLLVLWFVAIELYATLAFIRGALTTTGVTRWRMGLISLGSGLIALVILMAGLVAVFPAIVGLVSASTQFLAVLSGLSYYIGIAPPRWLRQGWQASELHHFLRATARLSPEQRAQESMERLRAAATSAVGGVVAIIAQWNSVAQQFTLLPAATADGRTLSADPLRADEGIMRRVRDEREAFVAQTPEALGVEGAHLAALYEAGALIAVPIATAKNFWGELLVLLRRAPLFPDDDISLLKLLAEQSAINLDYDALLSEQRAQVARSTLLAEISHIFTSLTSDEPSLLRIVAHRLVESLGDACAITMRSADGHTLTPVVLDHRKPERLATLQQIVTQAPLSAERGIAGQVVQTAQPLLLSSSPAQISALTQPEYITYLKQFNTDSIMIAPLRVDERVIGTLGMWRDDVGRPYTPGDLQFLQDLADRAALAIAKAQVFDAMQRQAQLLDLTHDTIIVRDLASVITFWNRGAEEMYGWSRAEALGQTTHTLLKTVFPVSLNEINAALLRVGRWEGDLEHATRDGRRIIVNSRQVLQRNARGEPQAILEINSDITERKRTEEQRRQLTEQLRALSAHLQSAREEERLRIARELHDGLGQSLTAIKMDIASLHRKLASSTHGDGTAQWLAETQALSAFLDETIKQMREIIAQLRPQMLDDLGLKAALEWQCQEFQSRTGVECQFDCPLDQIVLAPERAMAVFRILQESLTNVTRHAKATRVDIRVRAEADALVLEVRDNGKGITPRELAKARSFGILGMKERTLLLGGAIEIDGAPGQGTTVSVRVPLGSERPPTEGTPNASDAAFTPTQ